MQPKLHSVASCSGGNMNLSTLPFVGSPAGFGRQAGCSHISKVAAAADIWAFLGRCISWVTFVLVPWTADSQDVFALQVNGFTHLWRLPFQNSIRAVQTTWALLKAGRTDGCSYFGLQAPFRNIPFILYAVQLTQVLIISDFLPLPLLVQVFSISRWSDSSRSMSA